MKHDQDKNPDLQALWKKMAEEKFGKDKLEKQNIMEAIKKESNTNIAGLRKGLVIKMRWCLAFVVFFILLILFNISNAEFLKVLAFITAVYIFLALKLYRLTKKMGGVNTRDEKLLSVMKHNLKITKEALRGEMVWALFIYPISAPIGILMARTFKGESIMATIQDGNMVKVSLFFVLFVVPVVFFLTEKMNNYAYGTKVKNLEENIIRMETLG